jgi:ribosomal protein S18 acetylase RimI-like enzyme
MRASQSPDRASMAISIRQRLPAERDILAPLFGAYLDFYRVPRHPASEDTFLGERLASSHSTALGAFDGTVLAGFALCHHTWNSLRLAPAWVLHDLFVQPSHRRHGIARALLHAVQEKAAAAGACEVVLSTAHDNKSAQALYEIEGYRLDTEFRVYVRDLRP